MQSQILPLTTVNLTALPLQVSDGVLAPVDTSLAARDPLANFAEVLAANLLPPDVAAEEFSAKTAESLDEPAPEFPQDSAEVDEAPAHPKPAPNEVVTPAPAELQADPQPNKLTVPIDPTTSPEDSVVAVTSQHTRQHVPAPFDAPEGKIHQQIESAPREGMLPTPPLPSNPWQTAVMPPQAQAKTELEPFAAQSDKPVTPPSNRQPVPVTHSVAAPSAQPPIAPARDEVSVTPARVENFAPLAPPAMPAQSKGTPQPSAPSNPPQHADIAPRAAPETPVNTARLETPTTLAAAPQTRAAADPAPQRRTMRKEEPLRNAPLAEARFAPTTPTSLVPTKQMMPVTPWQAAAPLFTDQPVSKDLASFDPITGELRVSPNGGSTNISATFARPAIPQHIARQLAEVVQQNPNRTVEITLKPQELGAVRMSLQQAESGIVVNLTAERPETLDLMRRNIDQLGAEFQELGYTSIAFSFAGADADADASANSDDTKPQNNDGLDSPDAPSTVTSLHIDTNATSGVDLRL